MNYILVTGGAGFIGSNLAAALAERGSHLIVICDWFGAQDKWRNLRKSAIVGTITPEELPGWLERRAGKVDAIYHMGAISSTTETDVDKVLSNNTSLSCTLWDWAATHQVRFIYASSAATYGDGSHGFDDDISADYLRRLIPLNPYAWSKQLFDQRVARLTQGKGPIPPQWAGLKFFNVYGPNEYHKGSQRSVAIQFWEQYKAGVAARMFKSYRDDYEHGGQLRDFVYVKDVVDVMLWLLDNPSASGLFNVGAGKARSFKDLAHAAAAALGVEPRIEFIEMPPELQPKYQYFTEAKLDRLRSAGYTQPMTSLEDGVKEYVQQFLMQDDPYR